MYNSSSVQPVVSTERSVFYRERAAGVRPTALEARDLLVHMRDCRCETVTVFPSAAPPERLALLAHSTSVREPQTRETYRVAPTASIFL